MSKIKELASSLFYLQKIILHYIILIIIDFHYKNKIFYRIFLKHNIIYQTSFILLRFLNFYISFSFINKNFSE